MRSPLQTKRRFNGTQASNFIRFGGGRDDDELYNIKRGCLTLTKDEVIAMFAPSIQKIFDSCSNLLSLGGVKVRFQRASCQRVLNLLQYLLIVGGFGESPYLQRRLEEEAKRTGATFVPVDQERYGYSPCDLTISLKLFCEYLVKRLQRMFIT